MRINMCAAIIFMQSIFLIGAHVKAQQVFKHSPFFCELAHDRLRTISKQTQSESSHELLIKLIIPNMSSKFIQKGNVRLSPYFSVWALCPYNGHVALEVNANSVKCEVQP